MPKSPELDRIDFRILDALQTDARLSNSALAEEVGLSPSPCLRRVKKLRAAGVIREVLTIVEPRKIGLEIEALVQIRLQGHGEEETAEFERAVHAMPEVLSCFLVAGSMDYMLHTASLDVNAHTRLVKSIGGLSGVIDIQSNVILEKTKPWSPVQLDFGEPV